MFPLKTGRSLRVLITQSAAVKRCQVVGGGMAGRVITGKGESCRYKDGDSWPQEGPKSRSAAVRAFIGAMKPGNAGGAKGGREVEA